MTIYTTVLAVAMFAKGYRRAACFIVGVMIATAVTTTLLKVLARPRPARCGSRVEHLLETNAFPSGHASSIAAFAGVVMVLVAMLVRRANLRRLVYVAMVLVVVAGLPPTGSSSAATTPPT